MRLLSRNYDFNYRYIYKFEFGYDDNNDAYRVVVLDCKPKKIEVIVHCLGNSCWRDTLTFPVFPVLSLIGTSVSGTVKFSNLLV